MFESRSRQSKTEVNHRRERSQLVMTNLASGRKKHVESQYSSSSRKKTHMFTINASHSRAIKKKRQIDSLFCQVSKSVLILSDFTTSLNSASKQLAIKLSTKTSNHSNELW